MGNNRLRGEHDTDCIRQTRHSYRFSPGKLLAAICSFSGDGTIMFTYSPTEKIVDWLRSFVDLYFPHRSQSGCEASVCKGGLSPRMYRSDLQRDRLPLCEHPKIRESRYKLWDKSKAFNLRRSFMCRKRCSCHLQGTEYSYQ